MASPRFWLCVSVFPLHQRFKTQSIQSRELVQIKAGGHIGTMKAASMLIMLSLTGPVFAATPERTRECDKAAIGKSGAARQDFLGDCWANGVRSAVTSPAEAISPSARERKRRDCATQAQAQNLAGPARTTFMNVCLGD
jgi:hypothetical protein